METLSLYKTLTSVLALIIAMVGHEILHGWVAHKFKDDTAKNQGRLTINPLKHIDPIGTILVPALLFMAHAPFLFGWAKPVPINMRTVINNGGYGAAMQVSLAGIAFNLVTAVFASVLLLSLSVPTTHDGVLYLFFYLLLIQVVLINVVLAVFNLWPLPQFDGAHFLGFLGLYFGYDKIARFYQRYEAYGMFIVLLILMIPQARTLLFMPASWLLEMLLA